MSRLDYHHYPAPSTWVNWATKSGGYHGGDVESFFNSITVLESHDGTFFMTNGCSVGYTGLQDRSPKWVIFSIWDQPGYPVEIVELGPLTRTEQFGGEGTGGKSWIEFDWRIGETYSFCLASKSDGDRVRYSGFFLHPTKGWLLIATFRTKHPHDGPYVRCLGSFIEDWLSDACRGGLRRECLFGPALVCLKGTLALAACTECRGISQDTRQFDGYLNRHVYRTGEKIGVAIGGDSCHERGTDLYCGGLECRIGQTQLARDLRLDGLRRLDRCIIGARATDDDWGPGRRLGSATDIEAALSAEEDTSLVEPLRSSTSCMAGVVWVQAVLWSTTRRCSSCLKAKQDAL